MRSMSVQTEDIGFAVTFTVPNRYFTAELYVPVPGDSKDPEGAARESAARILRSLSYAGDAATFEITAARRVT